MPTVLITGANRGIGFEFARQYAQDGWRVHATARDPERASALSDLAKAQGGRVVIHALDVTDDAAIKALTAQIDEPIDLLINNSGVAGQGAAMLGATDKQAWLETFATNVIAPMHVTEALLPQLERGGRRLIVTISSRMGSSEANLAGPYAYRSSKAAVNRVMKGLAQDLGPRGFTVVSFNPGWVRTDMAGPNAPLSPEESIGAMRHVIANLTPADNGRFINYDGAPVPW